MKIVPKSHKDAGYNKSIYQAQSKATSWRFILELMWYLSYANPWLVLSFSKYVSKKPTEPCCRIRHGSVASILKV